MDPHRPSRRASETSRLARLALLLLLAPALGAGGGPPPTEYELKAAFLFKIATFTAWPEAAFKSEDAPFVVGVLGSDPFGRTLDSTMKDKQIGKHPVRVERYAAPDKVGAPHVLFVAGGDPEKAAAAVKALLERPILLVGDCVGFAARGGSAGVYLEKSQLRFELNPAALKRSRLVIEAQVLSLARIVGE